MCGDRVFLRDSEYSYISNHSDSFNENVDINRWKSLSQTSQAAGILLDL